jgi:glycosyltransferase involved in cell wall biosynthesis
MVPPAGNAYNAASGGTLVESESQTGSALRILMIAPTSFFADYGCHVRIYEETRSLQQLGHKVLICTYHNGSDVPGLSIRRSLDVPWRKRVVVGSSRHKIYLDAVLSLTTLRAAVSWKPDIIHAHLHEGALIGGVLSRLIRRPMVFDYQGSLTEEMLDHRFLRHGSRFEWLVRRLERWIDQMPAAIITSSNNARQRLLNTGHDSALVTAVSDAVDTTRFRPDALSPEERDRVRARLGIRPDQVVIGYLGLLAPYQGSDLLLRAAQVVTASRPQSFFLIMGFPGNEAYHRLARHMGLDAVTSFPGRVPYLDAHRFLAAADIAIAPKMSLTEGNGKIYNYMAMGLPVVAFDAPANREILDDCGEYARFGSADDLARQIIELIDNPERARCFAARARDRTLRDLSWDDRIHELTAVYRAVLARRAR